LAPALCVRKPPYDSSSRLY